MTDPRARPRRGYLPALYESPCCVACKLRAFNWSATLSCALAMPLDRLDRVPELALLELRAACERAIPDRESVPLIPVEFCIFEPADMPPLAMPFCDGPPFWVRLPFDGMLPFELPSMELTEALPFVLGVFMLADDPALPEDIPAWPPAPPLPAAMTGAASNPNAHTEANSPAFNIGRNPSCKMPAEMSRPSGRT
jgi:hypothetical protein